MNLPKQPVISIIGLGKLGASMAAAMASRGFFIIGNDVSERAVTALNQGKAPVQETDLQTTIQENRDRLSATLSHQEAVAESDVSFVIVPTPSDNRGAFSLQYAKFAMKEVGKALRAKDGYHLIVMSSTVLPGSCRYGLITVLEEESGKKCGPDFGFCYSPEFIALGSVIRDFLHPDFTLVGEFDERSGQILEDVYSRVMLEGPPCRRMSIENAELTKVCVNSYITTKITFANMVRDLCERIPGGDVDVVSNALGSDERIGHKYLRGGLGFGGPCFPRDNVALAFLAEQLGVSAELPRTVDSMNKMLPALVIEKISGHLKPGSTVAVCGLSYKAMSHIVEESQGIIIARRLADAGYRVLGYDPLAADEADAELKGHVIIKRHLGDCLGQADAIFIANPDPAIVETIHRYRWQGEHPPLIIDAWRVISRDKIGGGTKLVRLGAQLDSTHESRLKDLWGPLTEPS